MQEFHKKKNTVETNKSTDVSVSPETGADVPEWQRRFHYYPLNGHYLSLNSYKVLKERYLKKEGEDRKPVEKPEEMFRRVAHNIASAEKQFKNAEPPVEVEERFYKLMTSLEFMPNSPTLMNAGRDLQQLSACFVLPVKDSIASIFDAVRNAALIHKSGGGTGFSFSRLRPMNDIVSTSHGLSSGPISFMRVFNEATASINQGGFRRGANMGILRVDHPDILDFIVLKDNLSEMTNFNISVALTEDFMKAVQHGEEYDLINPKSGKSVKRLKASDVFDKIVHMAWKNGEPGIIFLDRINRDNPTPNLGEIESTNPCGEQPLLPYEACNLGSINLSVCITPERKIDWPRLNRIVRTAVHFLDNVIEVSQFPLPEIGVMVRGNRKIGLGIMGFADMLVRLGIPYNSEEAVETAEAVMKYVNDISKAASAELAEKRGTFTNFTGSIYDVAGGTPMRNATTTTIAPTGTISIISGCSSGIEPHFALSYIRTVMDGQQLVETNPLFEQVARDRGFYSEELMEHIAESGSCQDIDEVPEDVKRVFITSHDVTPEWHVRIQAAFQKYTDNAVSKTVNFPKSAKESEIREAYDLAYNLGCKGATVYRDGCRENQVLATKKTKEPDVETEAAKAPPVERQPRRRPDELPGWTYKMKTGCGSLYVTINEDEEGDPFEVFAQVGKAGGCAASQCEGMGRMVSLSLRSGITVDTITQQLMGISCQSPHGIGPKKIFSCADALSKALILHVQHASNRTRATGVAEKYKKQSDAIETHMKKIRSVAMGACPICGASLTHESGCYMCYVCGYSKC
ncbi:MAG: vitamin B12-dependent ribonucleotide reductase [Planctomycetota bacterium]|nr:MAG: vitamin B12-dependent ribonucleotide reductase [Planctomycetota bacterium]